MTKIAILGTAPGSRAVAPFSDPEWKIWACSQGNQGHLPRVDAWFELHQPTWFGSAEAAPWGLPYLGWLRSQTFPIYMQEKNDLVPQAIVFPYRRMIEMFGRMWFTSTVAWMLAYAIQQMREGDTIGLFGVDMAAGEEHYTAQRAGCVRMIEHAQAKGINVTIPHESCLGQPTPLYGYGEATLMGRKLYADLATMLAGRQNLVNQRDRLTIEIAFADGAIDRQRYMVRTFIDGEDAPLDAPAELPGQTLAPRQTAPEPTTTGDFVPRRSGVFVPPRHQVERANGGDIGEGG